jgi:predicted Fe-Mo cluster-binding NifX family protein
MKIAISAMEQGLDGEVDPRFGRSQYFIVVELETMQFETIRNPNLEASSGAGIGTAQMLCDQGVGAVLTGRIGPKAHQVLSAAGVRMITGVGGKVADALERYKRGKISSEGDSGPAPGTVRGAGTGRGAGMGGGAGMGRGMGAGGGGGMGRGMGQGRGCGGGGRGKGMGMGLGRTGGGGGRPLRDREAEPWTGGEMEPKDQDELALLKKQAGELADDLARTRQRIEQMEKS